MAGSDTGQRAGGRAARAAVTRAIQSERGIFWVRDASGETVLSVLWS